MIAPVVNFQKPAFIHVVLYQEGSKPYMYDIKDSKDDIKECISNKSGTHLLRSRLFPSRNLAQMLS